MTAVRSTYASSIKRNLYKDVKSETNGYLPQGLLALVDGTVGAQRGVGVGAVEGIGTKEQLLSDVLLSRSNVDLSAIKTVYEAT